MPARLTIYVSDRPARTFLAERPGDYVLGRDPACDVVLDDARVSRRHARLTVADDGGAITDLGSKNGTAVDGLPVGSSPLADGCWLSIGGLLVQYEAGERVLAADADERRRLAATLAEHRALAAAGSDAGVLVRRLLDSFLQMSGTERGFVLLASGDERFEVVASRELAPAALAEAEFSGSASTVRAVLARGEARVASDVRARGPGGARPSIVREGIRALVCVPLRAAGRTLGAVYADSRRPGKTFGELDLDILGALAAHAALALSATGVKEELEGLARGLPTRVDGGGTVAPLPGFASFSVREAGESAGSGRTA